MSGLKIGILGAGGVVGREMMNILTERQVEIDEIRLFSSARTAGNKLDFQGEQITLQQAQAGSFDGLDFVLGAVGGGLARSYAPEIVRAGAVFIDNSSSFRMDQEVPLIVPEINGQDAFSHHGIISNPNCSTIITLMAVAGLHRLSPIEKMVACTYQAVSGAGHEGLEELEQQTRDLVEGRPLSVKKFPTQIAMNVIPQIGDEGENGYTSEEMKMQNEGRRILHAPQLAVTCTCVRVPVLRSHSIAVSVYTHDRIGLPEAQKAIAGFTGTRLVEDCEGRNYPTPLDTSGQDIVWVGRVRRDLVSDNGICLWCCGDQIRKGAASNAVGILQLFA